MCVPFYWNSANFIRLIFVHLNEIRFCQTDLFIKTPLGARMQSLISKVDLLLFFFTLGSLPNDLHIPKIRYFQEVLV